jgi:hypothetical protein
MQNYWLYFYIKISKDYEQEFFYYWIYLVLSLMYMHIFLNIFLQKIYCRIVRID